MEQANKESFNRACEIVKNHNKLEKGIGTLKEKQLHAILKYYIEPDENHHEIHVDSFVADILNERGIIEIQTQSFNRLRKKLEVFLKYREVTVVYPIADTKWILWIDMETGEVTKKRKSPKKGNPLTAFRELYKIKMLLKNENIHLKFIFLNIEEYRYLNGWSKDKKKGSSRCEQIPTDIVGEINLNKASDYIDLIPNNLPKNYTAKDMQKCGKITLSTAQLVLNIMNYMGVVTRVGKRGNAYVYENNIK